MIVAMALQWREKQELVPCYQRKKQSNIDRKVDLAWSYQVQFDYLLYKQLAVSLFSKN